MSGLEQDLQLRKGQEAALRDRATETASARRQSSRKKSRLLGTLKPKCPLPATLSGSFLLFWGSLLKHLTSAQWLIAAQATCAPAVHCCLPLPTLHTRSFLATREHTGEFASTYFENPCLEVFSLRGGRRGRVQ